MDWTTIVVAISVPVISFFTGAAATTLRQRDLRHSVKADLELLSETPEDLPGRKSLQASVDARLAAIAVRSLPRGSSLQRWFNPMNNRGIELAWILLLCGAIPSILAVAILALISPETLDDVGAARDDFVAMLRTLSKVGGFITSLGILLLIAAAIYQTWQLIRMYAKLRREKREIEAQRSHGTTRQPDPDPQPEPS